MRLLTVCTLSLLAAPAALCQTTTTTSGWKLLWSDEFNGTAGSPPDGFVAKFRKQVIQTSGGCLSFNAQLSGSQSEQHADEKRLADRISFG